MNMTTLNVNTNSGKANVFHLPCVTIILPLEHVQAAGQLNDLSDKIEKELTAQHAQAAHPIITKLHHSLSAIKYGSNKKSVLIFLSPLYEKVIYLDVTLDEKILIDEQFEIRDLIDNMHPAGKFITLVQSAEQFRIFLGDRYHLLKVKVNIPDHIAAYENDIAGQVENFSDGAGRKEVMLEKFIHHIDKELGSVLKRYELPVFVIGPERMNGHFKKSHIMKRQYRIMFTAIMIKLSRTSCCS